MTQEAMQKLRSMISTLSEKQVRKELGKYIILWKYEKDQHKLTLISEFILEKKLDLTMVRMKNILKEEIKDIDLRNKILLRMEKPIGLKEDC